MFGYSHDSWPHGDLVTQPGRAAYGAGVPAGPAGLPSGKAPAVAMQVGRDFLDRQQISAGVDYRSIKPCDLSYHK